MDLGVTKIRHSSTQGGRQWKRRKHRIVGTPPSNGLNIHNDMLDICKDFHDTEKKTTMCPIEMCKVGVPET